MKLIHSFRKFLEDEVNLNKNRHDRINDGIKIVRDFLKANELFGDHFKTLTPQGSVRQGTAIKPINDNDFDVDLLYEIKPFPGWEAKDYLEYLHEEFKKTDRYKDIVDKHGKTRCVTLDYESDFHIDIMPCIKWNGAAYIMNRKDNLYEITDADGYANWFSGRCNVAGGDNLSASVKLAKYVRDHKDIPIKSVLLTTVIGNQIKEGDKNLFVDLPTVFKILWNRLDNYFQLYTTPPVVANPALPSENFNRHWDQEKFNTTKKKVHDLRIKIDEAFLCADAEESLEKWRAVFGDEFPLCDEDIGKAIAPSVTFSLGSSSHCQPPESIPGCRGVVKDGPVRAKIDGYLYSGDATKRFRGIPSGVKIGSGFSLKYIAQTNAREPFDVYWQVVNTGAHAASQNGLRGGFFRAKLPKGQASSNKLINWERSSYTGCHWIECFIMQSNYCVARSGRFYVNIKNPSY